jgi:hypothetical protein
MRQTQAHAASNVVGVGERKGTVVVTAAATIAPYQRHIKCSTSGAGAYALTFPSPEETAGNFYFVDFTSKTTNNITLTAVDRGSDVTLDATGEHVLIYSTGFEYVVPYAIGPSIS